MMGSMRSFASGVVAKLLMLLLVVSFGIWGIGDMFRSGGSGYAARVGKETITIGEFQRHKALVAQQMESMGAQLNPAMLDRVILNQLVQQKLINQELHALGLYTNDALVRQALLEEPAFQNADGSFNAQAFRTMLQSQRLSEAEVLKQIRDEAGGNFLLASMNMEDVAPPAPVRSLIETAALETRDAWIVSIAPLPAPATIDNEALQAFYEKNKSMLYMQPETRTIEYITLKPAQLDALIDAAITEQMLADAAKAQPKAAKPELRTRLRAEQRDLVLRDLQNTIDDALASGASLADAAKKAGLSTAPHTLSDALNTLAKTSTDDVIKTVAEQGFQMSEGETSGLIMTRQGTPVIVHVAAVHAATAQPYANVENDVRDHVIEQMRRDATRARVQEVKEALNQLAESEAKQWQSVLDRFDLSATRVTALKRPTAGKAMENNIPASLRQAIFEHPVGGVAGPLTLESGGQMLAIVTNIRHPQPTGLSDKRSPEQEKHLKELSTSLNQSVHQRALGSFAETYRVRANGQLLQAPAAESTP